MLGGFYFSDQASSSLRVVAAAYAINDVTGAPGFLVTMHNDGATAQGFHESVRCAHVS